MIVVNITRQKGQRTDISEYYNAKGGKRDDNSQCNNAKGGRANSNLYNNIKGVEG